MQECVMSLRRIDKSQWPGFCRNLTVELTGKQAHIEVASMALGVQTEARWAPIVGIAYDSRADVFQFVLDGLDHSILHPLEVYAEFGFAGIESLAIVDHEGWQIVLLRTPLMLPGPRGIAG
jgi:hypothetical protein